MLQGLEITQGGGLYSPNTGIVEEKRVEREATSEGAVSQYSELVSAQVEALEVVEAREGLAVNRGYPVVTQIDLNSDSEEQLFSKQHILSHDSFYNFGL